MAAAAISADFRFTRVAAVAECGTGRPANVLHGWGGGGEKVQRNMESSAKYIRPRRKRERLGIFCRLKRRCMSKRFSKIGRTVNTVCTIIVILVVIGV